MLQPSLPPAYRPRQRSASMWRSEVSVRSDRVPLRTNLSSGRDACCWKARSWRCMVCLDPDLFCLLVAECLLVSSGLETLPDSWGSSPMTRFLQSLHLQTAFGSSKRSMRVSFCPTALLICNWSACGRNMDYQVRGSCQLEPQNEKGFRGSDRSFSFSTPASRVWTLSHLVCDEGVRVFASQYLLLLSGYGCP